jgi:hypothetical protein
MGTCGTRMMIFNGEFLKKGAADGKKRALIYPLSGKMECDGKIEGVYLPVELENGVRR